MEINPGVPTANYLTDKKYFKFTELVLAYRQLFIDVNCIQFDVFL